MSKTIIGPFSICRETRWSAETPSLGGLFNFFAKIFRIVDKEYLNCRQRLLELASFLINLQTKTSFLQDVLW